MKEVSGMILHTNIGDLKLITNGYVSFNLQADSDEELFAEISMNCLLTTDSQKKIVEEAVQKEKESVFDSQRARFNSYGYSTLEEFEKENQIAEEYKYIMLNVGEENGQITTYAIVYIGGSNEDDESLGFEYCADVPVEVPNMLEIVQYLILEKVSSKDFLKARNAT